MKTILYISTLDPIAPRAHVYNVLKTVEALAARPDTKIELVIPKRPHAQDIRAHIRNYLGITGIVPVYELESLAGKLSGSSVRLVNWAETLLLNLSLCRYIYKKRKTFSVLYLRDFALFIPALFAKWVLRKQLVYEVHAVMHKRSQEVRSSLLAKNADYLLPITAALTEHYKKVNPHTITVACAASEPEQYERITEDKLAIRRDLAIPLDAIVLGYTGNMGKTGNNDPYGIEDIIDALPLLPENVIFIGYGKRDKETAKLESHIAALGLQERALIRPHVTKHAVYRFLKAADILVIPTAGNQIGNAPSKTYEYLAVERPIVAAKTVANCEVLQDKVNALLVDAKKPQEWADAITQLLQDGTLKEKILAGAKASSEQYTWSARAQKIISTLKGV